MRTRRPCDAGRARGRPLVVIAVISLLVASQSLVPGGALAHATSQTAGSFECVPSPLDFGGVVIGTGSVGATLTCTNTGRIRVTIVAVDVAGTHAADFTAAAAPCLRTLSPGDSCQLQVSFAPGGAGPREATLTVRASPQTPAPPVTVLLRGTGIPRDTTLNFEPPALVFPERLGTTTSPEQVVIATNVGTVPVDIGAVAIEDDPAGDFAVADSTCTGTALAPGASCQVSITFTPSAPGGRAATLRVDSNGTGAPHRLPLSGAGTTPAVLTDPAVGHAGTVTSAFGVGFPPGQPVTLQWLDAVSSATVGFPEPPALVTTNGDGTFGLSVLLFPKTAVGARILRATSGAFVADGQFLVVPATAQAPRFVTRG